MAGDHVAPPDVAPWDPIDRLADVFEDDDFFDQRGFFGGIVDVGFEGDDLAAAAAAVGGDDDFARCVLDAIGNGLAAEIRRR